MQREIQKLLGVIALSAMMASSSTTAMAAMKRSLVAPQKSVAIIDTGIDPTATDIRGAIVDEICFSHNASCPNGESFMHGAQAATLPLAAMSNATFEHGTEVISSAMSVNPSVRIIEVRCSSVKNISEWEGCNYDDIALALSWLYRNATNINLGAVVLPMATNPSKNCDADVANQSHVADLVAINIPVIASSGNNGNFGAVSNPACIPGVLAISATDKSGRITRYANYSSRVDFATLGEFSVISSKNKRVQAGGTSLSAGAFGAQWTLVESMKHLSLTGQIEWMKRIAIAAKAPVGNGTISAVPSDLSLYLTRQSGAES
jgi:hypothetical protein